MANILRGTVLGVRPTYLKVEVTLSKLHSIYKKVIFRRKRYIVDVKDSHEYQVGQVVSFQHAKRVSKSKSFAVVPGN